MDAFPDGLIAVVKRDCPTCVTAAPALREIAAQAGPFRVLSQDDPSFPEGVIVTDERELERSYHLKIEIVPTLIRMAGGREVGRVIGWNRDEWRGLTGIKTLGETLPENRPGCGAINIEPEHEARLAIRFGQTGLHSRRIALGPLEDDIEACYDRGWSDGLPIVPPTEDRVRAMTDYARTTLGWAPGDVIGTLAPKWGAATVEAIAANAVMAGCLPEYMPGLIAGTQALALPKFNLDAVQTSTHNTSAIAVVNGPMRKAIDLNCGYNHVGSRWRSTSTIGRALRLIMANIGGTPGSVNIHTQGHIARYEHCIGENEEQSPWEPLSVERGHPAVLRALTRRHGCDRWPALRHGFRRQQYGQLQHCVNPSCLRLSLAMRRLQTGRL